MPVEEEAPDSSHDSSPSQTNINYRDCMMNTTHFYYNYTMTYDKNFNPVKALVDNAVPSAAFDSKERSSFPRIDPHTRKLHLDLITEWSTSKGLNTLWLIGPPGAGKTALAQLVAELCSANGQPVASFFFSRSTPDRNGIEKFVATIALQVMGNVPGTRAIIVDVLANNPTIFQKTLTAQWDKLVIGPLRQAHPLEPLLVIVDGLDQCGSPDEQDLLLQTLPLIESQSDPVKLLFCCRPDPHLRAASKSFAPQQILLGDRDDPDIFAFFQHSFARIVEKFNAQATPLPIDSWPSAAALWELTRMACGQFSFAEAVIAFVQTDNEEDPRLRLDMLLNGSTKAFQKLDVSYLEEMQGLIGTVPSEYLTLMGKLTPHLVLHGRYSSSPLSISDLSVFWSMDPYQIRRLFKALDPLFILTADDAVQWRRRSSLDFVSSPAFPHPYSYNVAHFTSVTLHTLKIIRAYLTNEKDPRAELAFTYWCDQCRFSLPTWSLVWHLFTFNTEAWVRWAMKKPWTSVDSTYGQFIIWIESQDAVGWLKYKFPPQLLLDARKQWLLCNQEPIIRGLVGTHLRELYEHGEVSAWHCTLILNELHLRVLEEDNDIIRECLSQPEEGRTILLGVLSSLLPATRFQHSLRNLMPSEDQPWERLTSSPLGLNEHAYLWFQFGVFITLGWIWYGFLYVRYKSLYLRKIL
ncbi:hypothetical protein BDN72DRAFT_802715 [Pluteus cervinus]|uniref:Uncharacterized protein n=1 Tax=Pluteus cervinus TaxID=181527 RepID=A0ACD3AGP6_9AGAR|nr:hypothetical protein BDN72DRAFT_802715 [Pluteus cervinus]